MRLLTLDISGDGVSGRWLAWISIPAIVHPLWVTTCTCHFATAQGYNFSHLYLPFVHEAYRLLKSEGVLLCKIADYVHNHRMQWAHVDLIQAAATAGFCVCDYIVKIRKGPIVDPKWQVAHHARRHHCYWLVFRKSEKCE